MITVKVCPTCKHENKEEAAYCAKCGRALISSQLEITTRPVTDEELAKVSQPPPEDQRITGTDAVVALFVSGMERPILLGEFTEILLGREGSGEGEPPILDPELALKSGVSRNHATISFADGVYTIKDLGSKNGTYLNGKPMLAQVPYILQSGDQIRLGALTIYIYFRGE
ncbi:MAG: hypothetical protein Kow0077_17510 [Anaerolineae bacterium]